MASSRSSQPTTKHHNINMTDIKPSNKRDSGFGEDIIAPPPSLPPPSVPEGWLTRWDNNYKQFYFVNFATKKSQWEQPVEPARGNYTRKGKPK
jgi:hypothetical protein